MNCFTKFRFRCIKRSYNFLYDLFYVYVGVEGFEPPKEAPMGLNMYTDTLSPGEIVETD